LGSQALVAAGTATLYYFPITSTGSIGSPQTYVAGNVPVASSIDPSGQFLFQVNSAENSIDVYTLLLSGVQSGTPGFPTANAPAGVLAEPRGRFVYVANSADNNITGYALDSITGNLTTIHGTFAAGTGPASLSASNDGKYLYVANKGSGTVSIFSINS